MVTPDPGDEKKLEMVTTRVGRTFLARLDALSRPPFSRSFIARTAMQIGLEAIERGDAPLPTSWIGATPPPNDDPS